MGTRRLLEALLSLNSYTSNIFPTSPAIRQEKGFLSSETDREREIEREREKERKRERKREKEREKARERECV